MRIKQIRLTEYHIQFLNLTLSEIFTIQYERRKSNYVGV